MRPICLIVLVGMVWPLPCPGQDQPLDGPSVIQSSMIWSAPDPGAEGKYVAFRRVFDLHGSPGSARLLVFADARYLLWINGHYVLRGPSRFNPKRPEYDMVDVRHFLQPGQNVIAVLVHHYGDVVNGRIIKHAPGLGVVLEIDGNEVLRTDPSWKYSDRTMYLPAPPSWNSIPDRIDARIDRWDWISVGCDDAGWPHATMVDGDLWGTMHPSELPLPQETELEGLRRLPSGDPLGRSLPLELTQGQSVSIDFGTMAMAYTSLDIDADEGSILTAGYALRWKKGELSEMYGSGVRYVARSGRQEVMTTDQWCSHYLRIACDSGRIRIHGVKVIDRRYPFVRLGAFQCSDSVLGMLWDMAVRTIEVTSDDGYGSDARERNEWLQDPAEPNFITTQIALAGPGPSGDTLYADPRLLKRLLRHAALAGLPDGRIPATFPTDRGPEDCHYFIDDYACLWVEALKVYYDATGDEDFVRQMWPTLLAQVRWFLARRGENGLVRAREYASFDNPLAYVTCEGATINAFFYNALKVATGLARALDDSGSARLFGDAAGALQRDFNRAFWNDAEKAYNAAILGDTVYGPTVHAQLIALHYGLVPEERRSEVRRWFLAHYRNPGMLHVCLNPDFKKMVEMKAGLMMPVMYYWAFSELYRMDDARHDLESIQEMRRRWAPMVLNQRDAGTLSESFTDEHGEGASESCHNYGAIPAFFLSSYVLGVRRDGPIAEKRILIEPRLGDLVFAEGTVVTEYGVVPVSWRMVGENALVFGVTIPRGIVAELRLPLLAGRCDVVMNGKDLMTNGVPAPGVSVRGRWIIVPGCRGTLQGTVQEH